MNDFNVKYVDWGQAVAVISGQWVVNNGSRVLISELSMSGQ